MYSKEAISMYGLSKQNLIRALSVFVVAAVLSTALTGCMTITTGTPSSGANTNPVNGVSSEIKEELQPEAEKMPDLSGLKKEDAVKKLAEMGVVAKTTDIETDKEKEGCVFSHVPTKGKLLKKGDEVMLYIAKAKPTVKENTASKADSDTASSVTYLYCTAADYVSLRASANADAREIIKIPSGDGMIYQNKKSGKWYYVKYGNHYGFVYEDYVSFDKNAAINYTPDNPGMGSTLYCTAIDFVALRAGAGTNSTELARIPRGYSMTYLSSYSDKWYYVKYGSQKGYVYSDYVSFNKDDVPSGSQSPKTYSGDYLYGTASDFVALRARADVNSTELARIPYGYRMDYLGYKSGHWYYVKYGSVKGYVYDKYVTFDKDAL